MLYSSSIGLDVHARSIKAAAFISLTGELIEKSFGYDAQSLGAWIHTLPKPVQCIYESGPTGFDLFRKLDEQGITCFVGAVTKMLRPIGDRIKNDKRDAIFLARMLATGNIVPVYVPTPAEEAARDISRAREDLRQNLTRAKHHLMKFLLRKGITYDLGKTTWTKTYRLWLESLSFSQPDEQLVFEEYLLSIADLECKRERLDRAIKQRSKELPWAETVSRLVCLRGISTTIAFALVTEIGDFTRFKTAGSFASYLGLVPSLNESGQSCSRGRITKTGNTHIRKLLVEAAWHCQRPLRPFTGVKAEPQIHESVRLIATEANIRLHKRSLHLRQRKLPACKVNVAVARELAQWIWRLALMQA